MMHQSFEPSFECPSEVCPMCTGETCSLCAAGYMQVSDFCEHDVLERHHNAMPRRSESKP